MSNAQSVKYFVIFTNSIMYELILAVGVGICNGCYKGSRIVTSCSRS
jgi:hypothetical protein